MVEDFAEIIHEVVWCLIRLKFETMIVRCSWTAFHRVRCINVKWFRKAFEKASFSACHWYWWLPLTWKLAMMFYRNKRKYVRENRVQLPMAKWHSTSFLGSLFQRLWEAEKRDPGETLGTRLSGISAHQNGRRDVTSKQSTDKTIWSCALGAATCQTHEWHKIKKNQGRRNKTKRKISQVVALW